MKIQVSSIADSIVFRFSGLVEPSFPGPRISYLLETEYEESKQNSAQKRILFFQLMHTIIKS